MMAAATAEEGARLQFDSASVLRRLLAMAAASFSPAPAFSSATNCASLELRMNILASYGPCVYWCSRLCVSGVKRKSRHDRCRKSTVKLNTQSKLGPPKTVG